MNIADPIYMKVNDHSVLLMSDNTLIVSEAQIRRLIDEEIEFVTIDTDKGIDTFQSLLGQKNGMSLHNYLKIEVQQNLCFQNTPIHLFLLSQILLQQISLHECLLVKTV